MRGSTPISALPEEARTTLEQEAAFAEERAAPMRVRMVFVAAISALVWLSQLAFYEDQIFPNAAHSVAYRGTELGICAALLVYLRKPRPLARLEWTFTAAFVALDLAHAGAILVVFDPVVLPFTLTLEWGLMVIVLATMLSLRPTMVLLGATWVTGALATAMRANWDTDLSDHAVLLGIYAVLATSVRSYDRLRRAEFVGRVELERANDALRRAEEARSRLFVNLSHDFRTPLSLIHAEAEALVDEPSERERQAALARVRGSAAALAELTDQLLELARLDAGKAPYAPLDFDLLPLAREVAAQLEGRHHVVRVVAPVGTAGSWGVHADPSHLRRLLTNLVANGVRQVERHGGEVRVRFTAAGSTVTLDVEDDGPGVPAEKRALIFERFASFDAAGSVASGIGLPVARELARLNHGSLELVDGAPCTTFRVTLPTAKAPLVALPEASGPARVAAPATEARAPLRLSTARPRVLVVEDHPDMRRLLERLLEPRFDVVLAADVAQATAALGRERLAAVLTDVMLPDGDGYDVLAEARRLRHLEAVPVVMVSALAEPAHRARGLTAGADDYVPKPFSGEELRSRIEAACARAEARRHALEAQREAFLGELHDGVSASLARAALLLDAAERSGVARGIADAHRAVREALDEVRTMMTLTESAHERWDAAVAALRGELEGDARGFGVAVALEAENDGSCGLLSAVEIHTVRRLVREALTNAIKHASPESVRCALRVRRGALELRVEDDGRGLLDPRKGRGLRIVAQRAKRLGGDAVVEPRPEGGSALVARIPLELAHPVGRDDTPAALAG